MDENALLGLLVILFFSLALAMWIYAWWISDRPASIRALQYCVLFAVAGAVVLVAWRITSG